jgi:hypothetical protein
MSQTQPDKVWVKGYTRSNGKVVEGYWRQPYGLGLPKTAGTGTIR